MHRVRVGPDDLAEGIGMTIDGIESAKFLTEEQKRDIFYNDAVRFFKIR